MATTNAQSQNDGAVRRNILALRKKVYEVKFDLNGTNYIPIAKIGAGAYGVVCSATHKKTKENVAIKKTNNVFTRKDLAMRTYREFKILRHFKHDNIISIREILKPNVVDFRDVYMVLDLMESDLHQVIYTNDPLSDEHVRYFLYQMLRGLKYMHSANVIHRDLKPSNLLVNSNCELKIGDFGMARGISSCPDEQTASFMTQYVSTRWYRAPELMMLHLKYSTAVDVWSVGCIFAEMLGRKQLFPGENAIHQWRLITTTLGTPSTEFLNKTNSDMIRDFVIGLGPKKPIPFQTLYPSAPKKALGLLSKMLEFIPSDRMTVEKALRHPYLAKYHDPDDEPVCIPVFNFDFEKELKTVDDIKKSFLEQVEDMNRLSKSNITYNVQEVPKDNLLHNTRPSVQDPTSTKTATNIRKTEVGRVAEAHIAPQGRQGDKPGSRDQLVPEGDTGLSVDASKTTDDEEMLSAKTMALKISKETEEGTSQDSTQNDLKIDASKTTDDVEMLSAKTMALNISKETEEGANQDSTQNDLKIDASKTTEEVEMISAKTASLKLEAESEGLAGVSISGVPIATGVETSTSSVSELSTSFQQEVDRLGLLPAVANLADKVAPSGDKLDAKARIKAAILNGRKPRSMSESSENMKPRVTALQRQKQREDKRKKKAERAIQKKKKKGQAETKDIFTLSDADLSMLERWKNMQNKKPSENKKDDQPTESNTHLPSNDQVQGNYTTSSSGLTVVNQPMTRLLPQVIPSQNTNLNPLNQQGTNTIQIVQNKIPNDQVLLAKAPPQHPHTNMGVTQQQLVPPTQVLPTGLSSGIQVSNNQAIPTMTHTTTGLNIAPQTITIIPNTSILQPIVGLPQSVPKPTDSIPHMLQGSSRPIPGVVTPRLKMGLNMQTNLMGPQAISSSQMCLPTTSVSDSAMPNVSMNPWQVRSTGMDNRGVSQSGSGLLTCSLTSGSTAMASTYIPSFPGLDMETSDQSLVTLPDGWLDTQPSDRLPSYSEAVSAFPTSVNRPFMVNNLNITTPQTNSNLCSQSLPDQAKMNSVKDGVGGVTLSTHIPGRITTTNHILSDQTINLPLPLGLSPLKTDYRSLRLSPDQLNLSSHHKLIQRPLVDDLNLVQTTKGTGAGYGVTLVQTPKGTGAGYGVGLDLDLLLQDMVPMEESEDRISDRDPLSATLLAAWQEVSNMNPRDLEALEREMDMGFATSPLLNTTPTES